MSSEVETKQKIAQRTADLIVDRVKATGECTRADLHQAGFTEQTIDRCHQLAQALAAVTLNQKQISH